MPKRMKWEICVSLLGVLGHGCSQSHEREPSTDLTAQKIIGGVPANSSKMDAIGSLGFVYTYEDWDTGETETMFDPFCTASVIGERTVLTAKHCIDEVIFWSDEYNVPAFGIGPDGLYPDRIVEVVDVDGAPLNAGGFIGYGSDVGVAHLAESVADLTPLKPRALRENHVGKRMAVVGYGVQGNQGYYGTRQAGAVTVNALSGRIYELIFGSFEAFRDWWEENVGGLPMFAQGEAVPSVEADGGMPEPADDGGIDFGDGGTDFGDGGIIIGEGGILFPDDFFEEMLRQEYELELLEGYEAWVGYQEGDAQDCYGDSGGPLVKANGEGDLRVFGVVSGGLYSWDLICDYGGVHATFGPDTLEFLKQARNWEDPCEGLTREGHCDGDLALRCSRMDEGPRRPLVMDCSLLAQTCAVGSDGKAVCAEPGEEPEVLEPELPDLDDHMEFVQQLQSRLAESYLGPGSRR